MAAVSMPAPPVSSTVTIIPSSTATSLIWAARVTPPTRAILIVTPPAMPSRQAASSAAIESMLSSSTIGEVQCSRTRRHSASVSQGCSSTWSTSAASRTNRSAEEVLQPALASANSTTSGPAASRTAASRSASRAGSPPTLTCSRRYPSARCRRARAGGLVRRHRRDRAVQLDRLALPAAQRRAQRQPADPRGGVPARHVDRRLDVWMAAQRGVHVLGDAQRLCGVLADQRRARARPARRARRRRTTARRTIPSGAISPHPVMPPAVSRATIVESKPDADPPEVAYSPAANGCCWR